MILKLENTTTHQIFEYEVEDKNYGEKLYFRFDVNTLPLEDGEYSLTLYDGEDIVTTDLLRIGDFNPQTLQYKSGNNTYISIELDSKLGSKKTQINEITSVIYPDNGYDGMTDVTVDATPIYEIGKGEGYSEGYSVGDTEGYHRGYELGNKDGYEQGFDNGIIDQKSKLESINITENGIYSREDGFSTVTVDVPDLNGAYDDGYTDGYADGTENGLENAGSIIAETAQELDITENGYYLTKYVDDITVYPDQITGDFGDGTYFYNWGKIIGGFLNTKIKFSIDTRIEFWWKALEQSTGDAWFPLFGAGLSEDKTTFEIRYNNRDRDKLQLRSGKKTYDFIINFDKWYHFIIENGKFYLNDEFVTEVTVDFIPDDSPILINGAPYRLDRQANGLFGMFKVDDQIFIPKDGGVVNYETNEELGGYMKPTTDITYQYNSEGSEITGYFDDGTPFYGSANLYKTVFYTDIIGTTDSSFEVWWKDLKNITSDYSAIIGVKQDSDSVLFKIVKRSTGLFRSEYGSNTSSKLDNYDFSYDMSNWTHIKFSKKDGLIINGELLHSVDDKYNIINTPNNKFQINDVEDGRCANGIFGMVKINGRTFIPTENGFMDYESKQFLSANIVINNEPPFLGEYFYTENPIEVISGEGNLIKRLNVNVQPLLKTSINGISFGYSTFTKIPDGLVDWNYVKDMSYMFYNCLNLNDISNIDTSNVTNMVYAFYGTPLVYFPPLNTSKVTNMSHLFENCSKLEEVGPMDTSNVKDMNNMFINFSSIYPLRKLPEFDCSSLTNISNMFAYSGYSDKRPYLTDCGGWKNLKINWNDGYGLNHCPNLTYESCINILNGLWDFRGNGDASTTRTLKVHSNFLTTVGDEVSIGTDKGWIITT